MNASLMKLFPLRDVPAGNNATRTGSCFHQNKYPVQDDEYNYHDSLQAHLTQGIGHDVVTGLNPGVSVVQTIVLFRTTLTRTIALYKLMMCYLLVILVVLFFHLITVMC